MGRPRPAGRPGAFAVAAYPSCHQRRTGCCPDGDQPVAGPCRCFRSRTGCCRGEGHRDVAWLGPASGPSTPRPQRAGRATARAQAEPPAVPAPTQPAVAPTPRPERVLATWTRRQAPSWRPSSPQPWPPSSPALAARLRMLPSACGRPVPRPSMTPIGRTHPGRPTSPGRPCSLLRTPWRARIPGPWPLFSFSAGPGVGSDRLGGARTHRCVLIECP